MKNLSGIYLGLCIIFLFSLPAGAQVSGVQIQKKQVYTPPPPRPSSVFIGQQTNFSGQQTANSVQQQMKLQDAQTVQQWGGDSGGAVQQLKQFNQETKGELSSFSKL